MDDDRPKDDGIDFPEYPPMDESGTVDLWQLEDNLSLTPQERMRRYRGFIETVNAFRAAGIRKYGDLHRPDTATA